jgi:hypothetical protein
VTIETRKQEKDQWVSNCRRDKDKRHTHTQSLGTERHVKPGGAFRHFSYPIPSDFSN